ncbi:hypothetical protein [Shimia sagamensis]|uniref:hypothetical protein n=1 Tax=Shimia sagamensis TaxID=1566352 RepID=UPI0024B7BA0E|nr:hypothetical protein [Shimia sagamensis]
MTRNSSESLSFEAGPSWSALPVSGFWFAMVWLFDNSLFDERSLTFYWFAFGFSAVGMHGVYSALQHKTLSLVPSSGKIALHRKTLLGVRKEEYPLPDLKVAKFSRKETEDGSRYLLHLYFHNRAPAYLNLALGGAAEKLHEEITTTINTWLANHAPVDSAPPQA